MISARAGVMKRIRGKSSEFSKLCAAILLAAATFSVLPGCGSGSGNEVIAVVNGDPIPLSELENQLKMSRRQFFSSYQEELDIRKVLIDTLVIQQLLVQEAYKKNLDESEEVARIALSNKEKFLLDVLFNRIVDADFQPGEAEVQNVFDKLEHKFRASHILVKERREAEELLDSLEAGVPFGRLAFEYSQDKRSARDQGDLGYFIWGQMDEEFQRAVDRLSPNEISSPVKSRFGWHIIKLIEKVPNPDRTTLAQMKYGLAQDIISRNRSKGVENYFEQMREKYPVNVEQRTVEFLMNKREDMYPPLILERLPRGDFDLELLDRDEKSLPLASWDGGQMSIGEYLLAIRSVPLDQRPDFDAYDDLALLIFRLKFNEILGLEARRLGLEDSDEFKYKIKRFRELTMAEIMKDSLPQPAPPDEDQLMAYYNSHIDEFTSPEKIHVFEILVSDVNQARDFRKQIKGLKKLKQLASELTERGGKRTTRGDLGLIERRWFPELFDVAQNVAIGGMGGPVKTLGKWSVFYVVDKLAEDVQSYDQVRGRILSNLTRGRRADAFAAWAENVKQVSDITIYEDVVLSSIDPDKYPDSLGAN
ncbi:MAG: peptidylprolyl isomerase [candidate division Zixibacteria bacterium]|nr:peptidylprolyl isomerase [candidate division Zixibacteria bacterium]